MKNLFKRTLSVVMITVMLIPLLSATGITVSAATYSGKCGDNLTWSLDTTTGVLNITGSGDMYDYSWEYYDRSYHTTAPWGPYVTSIWSVVIGESVTSIGDSAFYYCEYLTDVTIPDSVTTIGDDAFYCCSIGSVDIPPSVTSIGGGAFISFSPPDVINISDLAAWCSINFGGSFIPYDYFYLYLNGSLITDLVIPDSVTSIADGAFGYCYLESVTIPDSVTSIGTAFAYGSLNEVTIPSSVTRIDDYAFDGCESLTTVNIPDSVTSIGRDAFYGCESLTSINIPDSVTSIGRDAFNSCESLTTVNIPDSVTSIGWDAFYDTAYYNNSSNWSDDVLYIGNHLIKAKTSVSGDYTIESGTLNIADYAFDGCKSLTSVTIPESVASIGNNVFRNGYIIIKCYEDSYAHTYAKDNEFDYELICDHIFTNYISDNNATCTEDGTKTAYCDYGCGATDTVVDEGTGGHKYTKEQILREPTCTKNGYKMLLCDCGEKVTETIPPVDHAYTEYTFNNDATCISDGTKTAYCDYGCGNADTVTAEDTRTGHVYTVYVYNNDATCSTDGTETSYCDYGCGNCDTRTASGTKTDHSYTEEILEESTCTAEGLALYICDCGDFYTADIPVAEHSFGDWEQVKEPTETEMGGEQRKCSVCGKTETKEIPMLVKPEVSTDNYTVTVTKAEYIKDIRYVLGTYTTTTEIRNAEGNVALDNKVIKNNTVDGSFVYDLPDGGVYSLWVRMIDGRNYIFNVDMTSFTPTVDTYGVKITIDGLYDVKDCFIAKGEFNNYNEIKDNGYIVRLTANKIAGKHSYTYTVSEPGMHTVLVRYNDGSEYIFHEELTVDEPVFTTNGLQVTVSNIPDVKVIRTAYGEYYTPGDTKRAPGARNFSNKSVIKDAEEYMLQYREEGRVTIVVEYNNGYVKVFHYDVTKKVPKVEQNGNTVTFSNLDGLVVIRYAEGEYTTSAEIKRAPGSKYIKPEAVADGKITVSGLEEDKIYTFCVQYDDESFYFWNNGIVNKEMKINGNDVSDYKIVYSQKEADKTASVYDAATDLQTYIEKATGAVLPIVTDDSSVSQYEILVGRTNREDEGLVSIDRSAFDDDQTYCWSVQGECLIITGIDSSDNYEGIVTSVDGTQNAVFMFGREVLGVREYIDDCELVVSVPGSDIDIADGYYYEDTVQFRERTFYMNGSVNASGTYKYTLEDCMYNALLGDFGNTDNYTQYSPCLSDAENISEIINNLSAELSQHNYQRVALSAGSGASYCVCNSCQLLYRTYGSRSAAYTLLINQLAELYPDIEFVLSAYRYCETPPKGIVNKDNVTVEISTEGWCHEHGYDDTSCNLTGKYYSYFNGWKDITPGGLIILDYSGNFDYFLTPMSDWDTLRSNVRMFADAGAKGIVMNSVTNGEALPDGSIPENHADFGAVRAYMLSVLYMDPYMTEEEFNEELNGCLEAYYGDAWFYMREYLDIITELGNNGNSSTIYSSPSSCYDFTEVNERADHIDSLWELAMAEAEADELYNLRLAKVSWDYLRQCATYSYRYSSGTDTQRAEYVARNEELYNNILNMKLLWSEGTYNPLNAYDPTTSPDKW